MSVSTLMGVARSLQQRESRDELGLGSIYPGEPVLTIDVAAAAITLDIPLLREVYELEIGYNA